MDKRPFWTVNDLRLTIQQWYGVTYKDNGSLQKLFRRCGFSYHKVEACTNRVPVRRMWPIWKRNSKKSDRFSADPSGCPDMNPQEHIWKLMRESVGHLCD